MTWVDELSTIKRHWLLRNSNIPPRFIGVGREFITESSGTYPTEIDEWLTLVTEGNIIKRIGGLGTTGVGLLFDGDPGRGKTTHAVSIIQEFIRAIPDDDSEAKRILGVAASDTYGVGLKVALYLTFPEFLSRKKSLIDADSESRRELHNVIEGYHGRSNYDWLNVRLLVLDDLGKEYGSKYDNTSFDEVLRSRYDRGLPTIITTNTPLENWESTYGRPMASFAKEAFIRVPLGSTDLRG